MATRNDPSTPANAAGTAREDAQIDDIVARGPGGTFAVVGVATFIVVAIVVLFYFLVFLPRGTIQ